MSDMSQVPAERWWIPVYVFDEITAKDTANVLRGMGYLVDPVYRDENWPPAEQ